MSDAQPFTLTIANDRALVEIRSWLPEHQLGQQSATLAGQMLPSEVGATLAAPLRILCVAPAQWLLVTREPWSTVLGWHAAGSTTGLVLLDATDAYATLTLRGRAMREVLSKGCGLDLHPLAFPPGRCARTRFAHIPLIVEHVDDGQGFDLHVARSYARWLADWLRDAALEFTSTATVDARHPTGNASAR
ncbi:MAG TPA: sarcosine oxidase subunit gamma family protein [Steroidobacteraceae bacterium]|nr:sarcosine oxidase subunit gamma family protein [Steroidobacteraceae bacterium]